GGRGDGGHRYLYIHNPHPGSVPAGGDDRLGQMGLLRPHQPRRRGGVRLGGRVRGRRHSEAVQAMRGRFPVRSLVEGTATGPVLVLEEPISFWGGVDPESGRIVESGHPQHGETVSARVLVLAHGRGSSSASSVLAEMIRSGPGPAALILQSADPIRVLGAVVADELYGKRTPV